MLFNKSTEYSIKILLFLNDKDEKTFLKAKNIAQAVNLPKEYVAKILQTLAKNGIISSKKGKGGGFKILDANINIKLVDLINIFEIKSLYSRCIIGLFDDSKDCSCPMNHDWEKLKKDLFNSTISGFASKNLMT